MTASLSGWDAVGSNQRISRTDAELTPARPFQSPRPGAPLHCGKVSLESLAREERVRAVVQESVDAANATLARPEQIKKFTIVEGDWLPSGDELTPTMKLKRKPIAEKYAEQIEELYAS